MVRDVNLPPEHRIEDSSTTEGLPIAPSLGPALEQEHVPSRGTLADRRVIVVTALAALLGVAAAFIAQGLMLLIGLITNIAFHGHFSSREATPLGTPLGLFVIVIPVIGAVLVGLMARYGSMGIRGHGIPEAMEQVLRNQSRIPPRLTFLKPLSAALSIGTGGPFGMEGPIIATGGALGSLVGQVLPMRPAEHKALLAAGAAAGMAATFDSPVSAVLLAVELLLFEFRPRSLIPVVLASAAAAGTRAALFTGHGPVFAMPEVAPVPPAALVVYLVLGAAIGVLAVLVTRAVYAVEDAFERLPVHWMWWPAIGAVVVGVVGYFAPRTLGVGYDNITGVLGGFSAQWPARAIAALCVLKFVSWVFSLGSGTSGGTLAPLFTIGGAAGALLGGAAAAAFPAAGVDVGVGALVGMAAIFAGASRAMLTSVVFAFETTRQPHGLPPLLLGCAASYLVSCLWLPQSIMTEKIVRRGVRVPSEYLPDALDHLAVAQAMSANVVTLRAGQTLEDLRSWIESGASGAAHQGFPVIGAEGYVLGVVTKSDVLDLRHPPGRRVEELIRRPPIVVYPDSPLRDAAERMVSHDVSRLPVIARDASRGVAGIITRSDVLRVQNVWAQH